MTMLERIREASFRAVSKVLNKDDDDRPSADEQIEASLCFDLDPYLARQVRKLNDQKSAASILPLRKAG